MIVPSAEEKVASTCYAPRPRGPNSSRSIEMVPPANKDNSQTSPRKQLLKRSWSVLGRPSILDHFDSRKLLSS